MQRRNVVVLCRLCVCVCVCLPYHLLHVTCFLSFLLIFFLSASPSSFPLRIFSLRFQDRCCKRRLNLGYNLSWLILCCIFVFD